jgi:large subunit ribosomal protein L35Ae
MEGIINNFTMSRHSQNTKHLVVTVAGVKDKKKAETLLGKGVSWKTPSGKEIRGTVKATHGNNGAVRVIFEKGMPGQSIGKKVKII